MKVNLQVNQVNLMGKKDDWYRHWLEIRDEYTNEKEMNMKMKTISGFYIS